jgi:hypothetical protein
MIGSPSYWLRSALCAIALLLAFLAPQARVTAATSPPVYPLCDCSSFTSLGHFIASGTITFDTSSLNYGGSPGGVDVGGIAVYVFDSITVPAGTTIIGVGSRPLALVSKSFTQINGTISVSGASSGTFLAGPFAGGAGGFAGGAGGLTWHPGLGPGGGFNSTPASHSGGGGAGFGGAGGKGGTSFTGVGGLGGTVYGDLATALQGGSGGASGSTASGPGGVSGGGGGGGAVLIRSTGIVSISASGSILANGGNGAVSANGSSGGGSGGAIVVVTPVLNHSGALQANGGHGGGGSCCGSGGGGGGGRILVAANAAGLGTYSVNGGITAAAFSPPHTPGAFPGTNGAVGVITIDGDLFPDCQDAEPPSITVPADMTVEAVDASGATVTFSASANDGVDGPLTPTCTPPSGSTFDFGPTTVTCTATDATGNTGTESFIITVVDTTPPTVTVPSDFTVEATPSGTTVTFPATANDNIDGPLTPVCTPPSGSSFPLGPTPVTCTATDASGNAHSESFMVTTVDTTLPTVTVPANITVGGGPSGATVTFSASANDNISGPLTPTCTPPSGSTFPLGTTPVTCTATDGSGNVGSASFTVTVADATPPVIASVTPSIGSLWPPNHKMVAISVAVSASDTDSPPVTCSISNVTSSEPDNGLGDGDTANDIQGVSGLSVLLRAERAGGGPGRVYTIAVTCTDGVGNSASSSTTVKVPANQKK